MELKRNLIALARMVGRNGLVAFTGDQGAVTRTIRSNTLTVVNGDGVAGDPYIEYAGVTSLEGSLGGTFDGGGSALVIGTKGDIVVPYNCTITQATLLADQVGSLVIDVWKDSYGNYPPTVGDSICGAAKPTLAAALKSQDTTLTGWTTAITAGSTLRFNIDSCSSITRATLQLKVTRT